MEESKLSYQAGRSEIVVVMAVRELLEVYHRCYLLSYDFDVNLF